MSQPIRYGLADEHLGRIHPAKDGHLVMWADYAALAAENEVLHKKLEFLRQAEHLVIWDGANQKWQVRHVAPMCGIYVQK